jgi:RNA polymerase sigma factor (sigma-70 family)
LIYHHFCHVSDFRYVKVLKHRFQNNEKTRKMPKKEKQMKKKEWLETNFEQTRGHLKAVAYRMLGSVAEAEDAVQETWIRLSGSDSTKIENLGGWLTTVVARVCLDRLRSRKSKGEESLDDFESEIPDSGSGNPEAQYLLADTVGAALLVVLETLSPAERIAFVLHDLFNLSFAEIAPIIDRTEEATRQLASRARRQVRGASAPQEDRERQKEVVSAFLAASREGNFEALIRLLHPDAVLRADATAIKMAEVNKDKGAPQFKSEIRGSKNVADTLKGKAAAAQLALIDGSFGWTWAPAGKPVVAFSFTTRAGNITAIDIIMDPQKLQATDIEILKSQTGGQS